MKKCLFFICCLLSFACKKPNDSNLVTLLIPTAFYPNSSVPCPSPDLSCNRDFHVTVLHAQYLKTFELHIYYEDQHEVFYSNDYRYGWLGIDQNNQTICPLGTYHYLIKTTDINGLKAYRSGNIMLLR